MPDKWRIGVLGSTGRGNYGHGLDTAWSAIPNCEVVAIADDNAAGLKRTSEKLNVKLLYADYHDLLRNAKPDIVAICPRWVDQHADMAIAAAEHGIHIYTEKPLCRTLAEADAIVAACTARKVKLAVAHPTRYSPMIKTIRGLIEAGELGDVLEYRARGKEDRRGGGEDLWVLGTHVLDMIHAIAGQPEWCFARVNWQGHLATAADVFEGPEGIGPLTGDEVQATYGMPDGTRAYFSSKRNRGTRPGRYGLQIHGSRGILELIEGTLPSVKFLPDPTWQPGRSGKSWLNVSSAGIDKPEPLSGPEYSARHTLAIRDFLDAIENNRQPVGSAEAGRDVTEMIAAVFESHRVGGPVELPLKTRENPLTLLQ